ncbi:MAG: iron-sulfur cluster assembly scaffold protein [Candidatus Absconditabacteria bacterium]|nr:iron-sulfur cluster assembly scaffold protein [Candidatus Absconditabacteria bacterium]MDD3868355.1 iron-sulfur cluster assembly scaffold protein [Candidatus Absconditabacteria bacterium]MDD4714436.1 iron-sulfur cluster assembly scaffold protein [Candidatus Absconditabacteria bacterium]
MTYGEPHVDVLIAEYNAHPVHNFAMEDATVFRHEGNFICGDDITVYLRIEDETIQNFSFDGNTASITTAGASLLAELIIGKSLDEVMERGYDTLSAQGLNVLPRRRRAAVIALLATRNAIHLYRKDTLPGTEDIIVEEFEDLLDD